MAKKRKDETPAEPVYLGDLWNGNGEESKPIPCTIEPLSSDIIERHRDAPEHLRKGIHPYEIGRAHV